MNKTLFKNEKQADLFKIGLTIFLYLIVFSIFKAGLDFQKLVPIKLLEKPEKNITYTYNLNVNGKLTNIEFNEKKTLDQILDSYFEKNIQFINYYQGMSIGSIYNSKNIYITIGDNEINFKKLPADVLESETKIKVNY
jgi:hypothetical protein